MTVVYFSVDVEATGPAPVAGMLLTVGIEAFTLVRGDDEPRGSDDDWDWNIIGEMYLRVAHPGDLEMDRQTYVWWQEQSLEARAEAWEDPTLERMPPHRAARRIDQFVGLASEPGDDRLFVSNPSGYDWQWINDLMWGQIGRNPFGHRSLCLRSMSFGLVPGPWGADRTDDMFYFAPELPHHSLSDAKAQAMSLRAMLEARG